MLNIALSTAAAVLTPQYETLTHRISSHPSKAKIKKGKKAHVAAVWHVLGFFFFFFFSVRQRHRDFENLVMFNQISFSVYDG